MWEGEGYEFSSWDDDEKSWSRIKVVRDSECEDSLKRVYFIVRRLCSSVNFGVWIKGYNQVYKKTWLWYMPNIVKIWTSWKWVSVDGEFRG